MYVILKLLFLKVCWSRTSQWNVIMFLFFFIKEKNCIRWTQQIYFLPVYGSFIAQLVEYCSANADFRWSSEMFFFRAFIAITTSMVIPSCILIHSLLVTERPLSACNHCSSRSLTVYILQAVQVTFNVSRWLWLFEHSFSDYFSF